jgi:hypothetical protein
LQVTALIEKIGIVSAFKRRCAVMLAPTQGPSSMVTISMVVVQAIVIVQANTGRILMAWLLGGTSWKGIAYQKEQGVEVTSFMEGFRRASMRWRE